ncbi:ParB/RepB/Spo0J family partition protein [Allohahella marinimesophila]|uniref:Probable chromosome-partitioning protein ParB n=1 Tax=Allohahella marinimesophila TaxID=1054972 RepID=A0ABP7PBV0_9GAMM
MSNKKRGLGDRGLNALLAGAKSRQPMQDTEENEAPPAEQARAFEDEQLVQLPIEHLQRGRYQPRKDMDAEALEELAQSIRQQGVMQPILVRPVSDGRFEIVAGERRWRASQLAGLKTVPVLVRIVPDEAAIAMSLIENIQREDLNAMEEAVALKRLQDEFSLTQLEVAEAVGKSRSTVTNLMRLLALSPEVGTLLERGDLEMGHARALLSLSADDQYRAARQIIDKAYSVRQAEEYVRKMQAAPKEKAAEVAADPDVMRLEQNLSEKLGAAVSIRQSAKGKGQLTIAYHSLDELEGILAHIR